MVGGEWDGDSPGSDEIFLTLALPLNASNRLFPLDENVSMSKRVDNKTQSISKKSEKNLAAQWYKAKEENG